MNDLELIDGLERARAGNALRGSPGGVMNLTDLTTAVSRFAGRRCNRNDLADLLRRGGVDMRFDDRNNRRLYPVKSLLYHLAKGELRRMKELERQPAPPRPAPAMTLETMNEMAAQLRRGA